MTWTVLFHDAFEVEFEALVDERQDELLAHAKLLRTDSRLDVLPRKASSTKSVLSDRR
jgi:hypothetical protein